MAIVQAAALSGDGRWALIGSHNSAILWDTATGTPIRTLQRGWVNLVSLSGDGRRALTSSDNTAILWDTATGTPIRTLKGLGEYTVLSLSLSGDGRRALTGTNSLAIPLGPGDGDTDPHPQGAYPHSQEVYR